MGTIQLTAPPDAAASSVLHRIKQPREPQEGAAAPGIETVHREERQNATEGILETGGGAPLVATPAAVRQTRPGQANLHHNPRAGPSQTLQHKVISVAIIGPSSILLANLSQCYRGMTKLPG